MPFLRICGYLICPKILLDFPQCCFGLPRHYINIYWPKHSKTNCGTNHRLRMMISRDYYSCHSTALLCVNHAMTMIVFTL